MIVQRKGVLYTKNSRNQEQNVRVHHTTGVRAREMIITVKM